MFSLKMSYTMTNSTFLGFRFEKKSIEKKLKILGFKEIYIKAEFSLFLTEKS